MTRTPRRQEPARTADMSGNTNQEPVPENGSMIPPGILDAAFEAMQEAGILDEECLLRKVETEAGVEWWLMDDQGELIEVFWLG